MSQCTTVWDTECSGVIERDHLDEGGARKGQVSVGADDFERGTTHVALDVRYRGPLAGSVEAHHIGEREPAEEPRQRRFGVRDLECELDSFAHARELMIVYASKKEGVGRAAQLADNEAWRRQREVREATDRYVERCARVIEVADGDVDRSWWVDVVVPGDVDFRDSARTETENGGEVILLPKWREWSVPAVNAKPRRRGQSCEG
jgi:hypothetical protein